MPEMVRDQNMEKKMEKQMGCMTGFLHLFDRHQMLSGKRLYTNKRLPPATVVDASPETEKSICSTEKIVESPAISKELEKPQVIRSMTLQSPDRYKTAQPLAVAETPPKSPLPLPIFEINEGTKYSWKFSKETPRLSLDSRATFDSTKGGLYPKEIRTNASTNSYNNAGDEDDDNNRKSPSVIARLMGLETLSNTSPAPEPATVRQPELRRSASESRVSREIFQSRLSDNNNSSSSKISQSKQPNQLQYGGNDITSNVIRGNHVDPMDYSAKYGRSERVPYRGFKSSQQRKSFFDSTEFFPEPKQTVTIYGEIERRLKLRGIDEQSKDLETLKQILEAMQLKGLLHSKKPPTQIRNKNFVYDRTYHQYSPESKSPIVLMKPYNRRVGDESPPTNLRSKGISSANPRRERQNIDRNVKNPTRAKNSSSPIRAESNVKNRNTRCNSLIRNKQLTIETNRRVNESTESRRVSPINSPKISPRRNVSDQTVTNRSPRNRKPLTTTSPQIYAKEKITNIIEDESSSSISESTVSTPSQTDTERSQYREGRRLLERCDKLLNSIAEMNANGGGQQQPSPVSVLDTSFYKDESSSSPSPVMKRSISFTDESVELEEELGSISSVQSKCGDEIHDCDFIYISDILRTSNYISEEADDIFLLLEKQQYLKGKDSSKSSRLHRRLTFDTIIEIVDRTTQLPPWKAFVRKNPDIPMPSPRQIWSEFQRIRERVTTSEDLFEVICGVLKKDLAGDAIDGWGECPVEMSEAVLNIERQIFKDLVAESIRDLADLAGKSTLLAPRRKLVF